MRKLLLLVLISFAGFVHAQPKVSKQAPHPSHIINWVQEKNYYLLTLFENDTQINKLLANDDELAKFAASKREAIQTSLTICKEVSCFIDHVKFTDAEIKQVSNRLTQLYKAGNALDKLVKTQLIPSGAYNLYKNVSPAELLVKAWEQDAAGINYTIDVYAGGKKPNYPLIDSISFNNKSRSFLATLYDCDDVLLGELKPSSLFFESSMHAALLYLQINNRQDPANYEPMATTVNKLAVDKIKRINWAAYPYSIILVPGAGPDDLTTALSEGGVLRCYLAAQQYRKGLAPYIVVSGGKVHPYKTKYCEAEEMKKFLVNDLNIPAEAVIMEPHARHTTTNMRNAVRLLYKYGAPLSKPGVSVTTKSQNDYIEGMAGRCMKELHYMPYKLGKRIGETVLEFYPLIESLQINPYEPLDP